MNGSHLRLTRMRDVSPPVDRYTGGLYVAPLANSDTLNGFVYQKKQRAAPIALPSIL